MNPTTNTLSVARRGLLASLAIVSVTAAAALSACGGRDAEAVAQASSDTAAATAAVNGNFEAGDFRRWRTSSAGSGAWNVYADGTRPPNPRATDPQFPFLVPQPPEGRYAAVTDMSAPGARILYRDVKLDGRARLRFTLFYENHPGEFSSPPSLDFRLRRPNQQLRVELMDPAAPVDSVAAKHVLATLFRTAPGDPDKLGPRTFCCYDLSRWTGKKVRIRVAQVDNIGPLRAGVDDVRLEEAGSR